MSELEKIILAYIKGYKRMHDGNSPSFREIMKSCNMSSTSHVSYCLERLEEAGEIQVKGQRFIVVAGGYWRVAKI
jgi:SOS-response transcriptional repressor LexA